MRTHKLAIVGITGRMGAEVLSMAREFGMRPTSGVAKTPPKKSIGVPVVKKVEKLDPEMVDVVIDFSLPDATNDIIAWCEKHEIPLVSGVTGITDRQRLAFARAGRTTPMLWSPNMSLGIAVMARAIQALSGLKGFDFQIEELHHNRKKDKPSGTAKFLQEKLADAVSGELPEPLAIRGGGVFGIHKIWALGEEEIITMEHTAMNRRVFARGALKAARWIQTMPAGLYSMDDILDT